MVRIETIAQLTIAHRIARYFGHDWGNTELSVYKAGWLKGQTPQAVYDAAPNKPLLAGRSPTTQDSTTTGRVRWKVDFSGKWEVVVSRPDGDVLVGKGEGSIIRKVFRIGKPPIFRRHLDAFLGALDAITGCSNLHTATYEAIRSEDIRAILADEDLIAVNEEALRSTLSKREAAKAARAEAEVYAKHKQAILDRAGVRL